MAGERNYWFPAKRIGWGWGLPTVWQGWAALGVCLGLVAIGSAVVLPTYGNNAFLIYTGMVVLMLLVICLLKGEPPSRR